MSKLMKKFFLLIIVMLSTTTLAGCSVEITMQNLNKYVDIGKPRAGTTGSLANELQGELDSVTDKLDKIEDAYTDLDITVSNGDTFAFQDYIRAMQNWHSKIKTAKLTKKDSSSKSGTAKTEIGEQILSAIVIDKNTSNSMLYYTCKGITAAVAQKLNANSKTTISKINFDGTTVSSSSSTTQISDVDRALSIMGLKITGMQVELYYADTAASIAYFNNGTTKAEKVNTFIEKDYLDFTDVRACSAAASDGGRWGFNPKTTPNETSQMFEFSCNTKDVDDYIELSYQTFPYANVPSGRQSEIKVGVRLISDSGKDDTLNNCFKAKATHGHSKSGGKLKDKKTIILDVADNHPVDYVDLRSQFIRAQNGIRYFTADELKDITWYYSEQNSKGDYTDLYIPLAAISQIDLNTFGANDKYWGFCFIHFELERIDGASDIRTLCVNDATNVSPYTLLPTKMSLLDAPYNSYAPCAANKLIEGLAEIADCTLLGVKEEIPTGFASNKASTIFIPTTNKSPISVSGQTYLEVIKDNKGDDITINLLSKFKNGKGSDAIITEQIQLYIADKKFGTMYVQTFSDDLAMCDTINTITSDGMTRGSMQKYKMYRDASNKLYLLYGITDVAYISEIVAEEDATKADGSHIYTPKYRTGGLIYNLFDNKLYMKGDTTASTFDTTGGVKLYTSDNVLLTNRINASASSPGSRDFFSIGTPKQKVSIAARTPILVLNQYLEGMFLPGVYEKESFVCLGRKITFNPKIFDKDFVITENTPVFTVSTPQDDGTYIEGLTTHTVAELLSSTLHTRLIDDQQVTGIVQLPVKGHKKDVIRNYLTFDSLKTISSFRMTPILAGEFKTQSTYESTRTDVGHFASKEDAIKTTKGTTAPRLYVWCTSVDIDATLKQYLESSSFTAWQTWLNNNGYKNYLPSVDTEKFVDDLVIKIESVYDLTLSADDNGRELIVDSDGLDELNDWINKQAEKKRNAVIDIILRIVGIVLLVYGIAMLVCYIIDVAVSGEGSGLLKKFTFNRMMTVTGLSKEERKAMSQRNEKDTYTTRATALIDLIPVILILWGIATIVLIGSTHAIADKLLEIAKIITEIFRGAIDKK